MRNTLISHLTNGDGPYSLTVDFPVPVAPMILMARKVNTVEFMEGFSQALTYATISSRGLTGPVLFNIIDDCGGRDKRYYTSSCRNSA